MLVCRKKEQVPTLKWHLINSEMTNPRVQILRQELFIIGATAVPYLGAPGMFLATPESGDGV